MRVVVEDKTVKIQIQQGFESKAARNGKFNLYPSIY